MRNDRQTDRQTDRPTDRQPTERERERVDRERQRERDRGKKSEVNCKNKVVVLFCSMKKKAGWHRKRGRAGLSPISY